MREFRYKNATIRISGETDREKLEEAVKTFYRRIRTNKKNQNGGNKQNGNVDKTRTVTEE